MEFNQDSPSLHDFLTPMYCIDHSRHNSCDLDHNCSGYVNWAFVVASMVAGLKALYLTKGKSKFHLATTKHLLLPCSIIF